MYGGARFGNCDLTVGTHQTRYHEVGLHHIVELQHAVAVDEGVGHFNAEKERFQVTVLLLSFDIAYFLLVADAENPFYNEHAKDNAKHAERVGGGISVCHGVDSFGVDSGDCGNSLLGGGKSRGVGHRSAHHTYQRGDVVDPSAVVYYEHQHYVEGYTQQGESIEAQSAFLERREETGTDLQAYGKNEQYEAELTHELEDSGIDFVAEMTHQNAYEQNKGNPKRNAGNFYFADEYSGGYYKREKDYRCRKRRVFGEE